MPLLARALVHGVRSREAVFDNGYASHWNYEIPSLLLIKPRIGFQKREARLEGQAKDAHVTLQEDG